MHNGSRQSSQVRSWWGNGDFAGAASFCMQTPSSNTQPRSATIAPLHCQNILARSAWNEWDCDAVAVPSGYCGPRSAFPFVCLLLAFSLLLPSHARCQVPSWSSQTQNKDRAQTPMTLHAAPAAACRKAIWRLDGAPRIRSRSQLA